MATLAIKPTEEIGRTGLIHTGGYVYEELLTQLRSYETRIKVYKEMSANDAIVGGMLNASDLLIRSVPWTEEPASSDNEDLKAAEFLGEVKNDMSHTWTDFISEAMTMLPFGWAWHELVYKKRLGFHRDPSKRSKFNDGKIGLRKMPIRSQDSWDKWEFDDEGGVQALTQRPAPTYEQFTIPIEKSLLFRTVTHKNNPEGLSVLRNSYRSWFRKKRIEEFEGIGIERDATGLPIVWAPARLFASDASAADQTLLAELKKIARGVRMDEQMGLCMPLAYDENKNKLYDFTLATTGGKKQIDTTKVIQQLNQQIATPMMADVILMGHEKVGSFALASSKTELFAQGLGVYLDSVEDVLNRHMVPRLFMLNGAKLDELPQYRHGDIESVDLSELAAYIKELAAAGMVIFPSEDGELETWLKRQASMPVTTE
jgi:hypothetical protein